MNDDVVFVEEEFVSKANLMVKKIFNAITMMQVEHVQHFMDPSLYQKVCEKLERYQKKKERVVFEQVNISSYVLKHSTKQSYLEVEASVMVRAIVYCLSTVSNQVVSGDAFSRREFPTKMVFRKRLDSSSVDVPRCLGCGTTIDVYGDGICPNCGRVYDLANYDYIIQEMDW